MIVLPFAKINLGLHVLRKRPDGYHDIESVLVPIPLRDALEAVIVPDDAGNIEFTRTGLPVPGLPEDDLCMKAVALVKEARRLPGLHLHLHKAIPIGAGLGGGSSDATHVLLLLNELLDLGLSPGELHGMAAKLGSDCPFFLGHTPQLVEGRGERMRPVDPGLHGRWLVLLHPGIHVSTAEVYRNTVPQDIPWTPKQFLLQEGSGSESGPVNDMEAYVFGKHPEIAAIKQDLLDQGAAYAAMSGSGSSVFGIFNARPLHLPSIPEGYKRWILRL